MQYRTKGLKNACKRDHGTRTNGRICTNDFGNHRCQPSSCRTYGAPAGGQSHFELKIASSAFDGKSRVASHRMVNQAVADLLAGPIHALQITIVK